MCVGVYFIKNSYVVKITYFKLKEDDFTKSVLQNVIEDRWSNYKNRNQKELVIIWWLFRLFSRGFLRDNNELQRDIPVEGLSDEKLFQLVIVEQRKLPEKRYKTATDIFDKFAHIYITEEQANVIKGEKNRMKIHKIKTNLINYRSVDMRTTKQCRLAKALQKHKYLFFTQKNQPSSPASSPTSSPAPPVGSDGNCSRLLFSHFCKA